MEKINVYEKPACTTCRKMIKLLKEKGYDFDRINYYIEPFTREKLEELLKKAGMKPSELIRRKGDPYKSLDMKNINYTEEQILNFMVGNPDLVERPIIEKGNKAVLARPIEKALEIL